MDTAILRRACNCLHATASGPRMAHTQTYPTKDTVQITMRLVGFACDRCGKEWTKEIQPSTNDPAEGVH